MTIEATIINIILGVVSNGVTSFIACYGTRGIKFLANQSLLEELKTHEAKLAKILHEAIDEVANEQEYWWKNPEIDEFLRSPEVESIVRQLFATQVSKEATGHLDEVYKELEKLLFLKYPIWSHRGRTRATEVLFNLLLTGCQKALDIAIENNILSAHEAKSTIRHHMVLNELAGIRKNLDFLTSPQKTDVQAITDYEKKYRSQVGSRYKFITPPDFDRVRRIPINQLYVVPNFIAIPKIQGEEPYKVSFEEFCSSIYRCVLLGDPGGGKSTFSFKLAHDLATRYEERLFSGRQVTPLHVTLRDYGAAKKETSCSIVQFIRTTAESHFQLSSPPPGTFEYLLLNGRVIVIFDGLDELLETNYRQEISADIESFCTLYPAVPVLITSRKVGYDQAPLDPEQFNIFHLAPFDDKKARTYVTNWFNLDTTLTSSQQKQKVEAFLQESETVSDLRENALLLALLCNIYRGEGYLPRNRPDVYEKCADMLFRRWDKGRGINYLLPFEAHIEPAIMYLAHWIYSDEARQKGATEQELIPQVAEYLHLRQFDNEDEAKLAARSFIEFCRGRAWIFTDTGTTKDGDELYQFSHRTFLEYFAAAYLVRIYRTPNELIEFLLLKIRNKEWDVVAQLAFQMQNKRFEEAGDELLSLLLKPITEDESGWNTLSFILRCLEFMVPSPSIKKAIINVCVTQILNWGMRHLELSEDEMQDLRKNSVHSTHLIRDLRSVALENQEPVAQYLKSRILESIRTGNELEIYILYQIVSSLSITTTLDQGKPFWRDIGHQTAKECNEYVKPLLNRKFLLYLLHLDRRSERSIDEVVRIYGVRSIFKYPYHLIAGVSIASIASTIITDVLDINQDKKSLIERLKKVYNILLLSSPPWVGLIDVQVACPFRINFERRGQIRSSKEILGHSPAELFVTLLLISTVAEIDEKRRGIEYIRYEVRNNDSPLVVLFRNILLARYGQDNLVEVEKELTNCRFEDQQKEFIWRWINQELNFVDSSG